MNTELTETSSPNFHSEGKAYLVLCPECHKENYAISVSSGICVWCGYDLNKHKVIKDYTPQHS